MKTCIDNKVDWAIFSDKYGIWSKNDRRRWYEKPPDSVTNNEFNKLVIDFETKLENYDEIWFYYNPGRFHKVYRKLLNSIDLKVKKFTHLSEIS
jgi:hypothetical protein